MAQPGERQESDLDFHRSCLELLCRLCKEKIMTRRTKPVAIYKKPIERLHDIDIDEDNELIHPKNVCNKCERRLDRYKKISRSKKKYRTSFEPATFVAHDDNCEICDWFASNPETTDEAKLYKKMGQKHKETQTDFKPDVFRNIDQEMKETQGLNVSKKVDMQKYNEPQAPVGPMVFMKMDRQQSETQTQIKLDIGLHMKTGVKRNLPYAATPSPSKFIKFDAGQLLSHFPVKSLPVDCFIEKDLAEKLKCRLCLGVPLHPASTQCGHLFCQSCIKNSIKANVHFCPMCKQKIEYVIDLTGPEMSEWTLYSQLHVPCTFKEKGCEDLVKIKEVTLHQNNCKYGKYPAAILKKPSPNKGGPWKNKMPLVSGKRQYIKRQRLKDLIEYIKKYCVEKYENRLDVLFFLLLNELMEKGLTTESESVRKLWEKKDVSDVLSADECLAMRVETLQSKVNYRKQYDVLREMNNAMLKPPSQLDSAEELYMPGNVEYEILDPTAPETVDKHEVEGMSVPQNILEDIQFESGEPALPKCTGVRWSYAKALAKTLQELCVDIEEGLEALDTDKSEIIIKVCSK